MAEETVRSDLRGIVSTIEVGVADRVDAGQTLIFLESMKTEIPVPAPQGGTVARILVAPGDLVDERQPLLVLET